MSTTASAPAPTRARRVRTDAPPAPQSEPAKIALPAATLQAVAEPQAVAADGGAAMPRVRKPFGGLREKLDGTRREGFHRHWFNDTPGRIKAAKEAGYENVVDDDGKPMKQVVGVKEGGGELVAYRMEIPIHWYDEDQAAKDVRRDELDAQMRRGAHNGSPGQDGRYVPVNPDGTPRIKITSGS